MGRFKKLLETSIPKTLRFNLHYFGWGGVRFPVLVARNCALNTVHGKVTISNPRPGCVRLGYSGVDIFDSRYDRSIWSCAGGVHFEGDAYFGHGSKISVGREGRMNIGDGFRNTAKGEFVCHQNMQLGAGALVSWDTLFMDTDTHQVDGKPASAPVVVGDRVWVGCRCIVLKGAVIPNGSVIAAGSTITKKLEPEKSLFAGVNKLIRTDIEWNI